jgi:hypothetical protein
MGAAIDRRDLRSGSTTLARSGIRLSRRMPQVQSDFLPVKRDDAAVQAIGAVQSDLDQAVGAVQSDFDQAVGAVPAQDQSDTLAFERDESETLPVEGAASVEAAGANPTQDQSDILPNSSEDSFGNFPESNPSASATPSFVTVLQNPQVTLTLATDGQTTTFAGETFTIATGSTTATTTSSGAESTTSSNANRVDGAVAIPPIGEASATTTTSTTAAIFTTTETISGSTFTVVTSQGPAITLAPSGITTIFGGATFTVEPPSTSTGSSSTIPETLDLKVARRSTNAAVHAQGRPILASGLLTVIAGALFGVWFTI